MKKYIIIALILSTAVIYSCTSDSYKIGGGITDEYVDKSTLEYLKERSLFDTLVMGIERGGLEEAVNGEVTLFATTNYSFTSYTTLLTAEGRKIHNDPDYLYTFDSIPSDVLRDSLSMYIFPGKITREDMTKEGAIVTNLAGTELRISLEPRKDYIEELPNNNPQYVFLTYKIGEKWDEWDAENVLAREKDIRVRIQTSNTITTTGVVHVIENSHRLFFEHRL